LSIAYISLINTVNNLAERDQFLGRPIINVTDEGHIITRNPLLAPYVVKITKMWRKLGAWYWLATQNVDDLPKAAEPSAPLEVPPVAAREGAITFERLGQRGSSVFGGDFANGARAVHTRDRSFSWTQSALG
jgi:hypothetical protein